MNGKKTKTNLCYYALITCALILTGCAKQQQYALIEQIHLANIDKSEAMQAAEDVLTKMHFTIDKADPQTGFMRTKPLPGAQFFEFWRKDNVGAENAVLANLHSIRRVVELNVSREEEKLRIGCNVQVYRLSLPQRQIASSAHAYEMFSKSTKSMQTLKLRPEQKQAMAWTNLGQDKQLATEILKRISSMLDIEYRESSIE